MRDLPIHPLGACARRACCRAGKIGARELLDLCWAQVEKHNTMRSTRSSSRDIKRARKAAAAADRRLKRGEPLGPFDGVPMTIKESLRLDGHAFDLGRAALCATTSPRATPWR